MRIEWFIKEHLSQLNQDGDLRSSLLPISSLASPPGHLRYVSTSFLIYINNDNVVVDLPVSVDGSASVLRVEASYTADHMPQVLNACYGAMSVFLKAIFLLGIETGTSYEQFYNHIRSEMDAVLRHFYPQISEAKKNNITYTTDLLDGWTDIELYDTPFQLTYAINNETGAIAFLPAGLSSSVSDTAKHGWISLQCAPYQPGASADAPDRMYLADLRLVFMAGSGRNVSAWDLAVGVVAVPILNMLVK